jgi:hypothetical protein
MTAFEWEQDEAYGVPAQEHEQWGDAGEDGTGEVFELEDSEEFELAGQLLEVTSEEELEQFLGKLFKKVAKGASALVRSPIGKALGGVLKNVAKTALPMVGSAVGTFVAPGIGTAIGGQLGSMASKLLEAEELESMDEAEAELEAARRYVRWASGTIRNATRAPRGVPPRTVVRSAAVSSARRYAPALLRSSDRGGAGRQSAWRRRRGPGWGAPGWGAYGPPQACSCGAPPAGQGWDQGDQGGWDQRGPEGPGPSPEDEDAFEAPASGAASSGERSSGRWARRGNRIVLLDV